MSIEKIKVLVVDDEPIAHDILETYITKLPDMHLAGHCNNALQAFKFLSGTQVDILLLDINMPEITGIELLRTLKDPPLVIFTTAYSEYAVESYELNAVDYLLKPIAFDRFLKAINKATDILRATKNTDNKLIANDNLMFVKTEGRLVRIDLKQLLFIEGLKDYVRLWLSSGKIVVHSTMKNMEDHLSSYPNFMRVHKSYIVNVEYIKEVDGNCIRIHDQSITIGSTYRDDINKMLDNYKLL